MFSLSAAHLDPEVQRPPSGISCQGVIQHPPKEGKAMANDTLGLTDEEVLEYARTGLEEHLGTEAGGCRCSAIELLDVLLAQR